jgi:photosystem II stability/assembly factor-like uncharacterized protein
MRFAISFLGVFCLLIQSTAVMSQSMQRIYTGSLPETSFYDIYKVSDNNFFVACKNGILAQIDSLGNLSQVDIPAQSNNLLKIERFNDSTLIVVGDQGSINIYRQSSNTWELIQLSAYKGSAFYSLTTDEQNSIYINGGASKIACGEKAIPKGFVLKSTDGGKSWEKIYSKTSRMVWDIQYNKTDNKLYAITYAPWGSKLICSDNHGKSWKTLAKSAKRDLFHALQIDENGKLFITGGNYNNSGGQGAVYEYANKQIIKHSGSYFMWDLESNQYIDIATCSKGWLMFRLKNNPDNSWQEIHSNANYNLYEVCKISETSFWLVGSKKTLIKFSIDSPSTTLKQ